VQGLNPVRTGEVLWQPHADRVARAQLTAFMRWLHLQRGRRFESYEDLWHWSVTDLEGFWASIWDYFLIRPSVPYSRVLGRRQMPGAQWFPGARLNYAEHALRNERPGVDAILYQGEGTRLQRIGWPELGNQVRTLATRLRELGVKPGDRVVACLPNVPEAVIAMLATVSIGAIWASCGPDFGARGVLDRFTQLDPKVFFCVTRYRHGGMIFNRLNTMRAIVSELKSLKHVVHVAGDEDSSDAVPLGALTWSALTTGVPVRAESFAFEQVPFDHPLWILFTSGTTGLPKPIVHGHGGILLEQLKHLSFNFDAHPRQRVFFYTTTGWMMWNFLAGALLSDVVPVLYDGHPTYPDPGVLWKLVEESRASVFGASPSYMRILRRSGFVPRQHFDLAHLDCLSLAGSPVSAECMAWCSRNVKDDLWVAPGSGGTEVCTGFVGGVPVLPVRAGEIQARSLGCAAYALNERGERVINEVGELVVTAPMPSMPLYFWRDKGYQRYRESYFDVYPGLWRHGDLFRITRRGGCQVLGRSDATLKRHGVRIGTAEIYRALERVEAVDDALIVSLELPGGGFFMPLFVTLKGGLRMDERIEAEIRARLREDGSPRHVPDRIYRVDVIPYTRSGKKMELPVRHILMGVPLEKAADVSALAVPGSLDWFVKFARRRSDYSLRRRA